MIDEILAHISTPATRQNDNLYRSLANAYLEFEPQRRHGTDAKVKFAETDNLPPTRLENHVAPAESSVLSTSRESYGSFPSHISSGDYTSVPGIVDTQSIEEDSLPTSSRLARLERIHRLWKEQTTPRTSLATDPRPSGRTLQPIPNVDTTLIEDTQLGAQALQSQLHEGYSTTDEDTSEDEALPDAPPQLAPSVPLDVSERAATEAAIEKTNSMRSMPIVALGSISANERAKPHSSEVPKHSLALATKPNLEVQALLEQDQSAKLFDFSKLPVDAFPPAPKISTECPGKLPSQVTKHLGLLKSQNPKRFKLSKRHGTPRYDDRGHWSVNTSTWPVVIQKDFWNSMHEHTSSGRLGWGVTLYRGATSPNLLGIVRVYCWAEILEHLWLMMWLCSKGEIVRSGCDWIDADGKAMFEVAGR